MPYDLYDHFMKEKSNPLFSEISDIIRDEIWAESIDFVMSQNWLKTEDKLFILIVKEYSDLFKVGDEFHKNKKASEDISFQMLSLFLYILFII